MPVCPIRFLFSANILFGTACMPVTVFAPCESAVSDVEDDDWLQSVNSGVKLIYSYQKDKLTNLFRMRRKSDVFCDSSTGMMTNDNRRISDYYLAELLKTELLLFMRFLIHHLSEVVFFDHDQFYPVCGISNSFTIQTFRLGFMHSFLSNFLIQFSVLN